ncbi:methyltransferase type 11 [Halorubrum californiense DSM 19288]|uniref:Methyltransferase type 11 n=1 Tax=Halorubrum californiense DSM 19288 TaxID=1227465 RepID=M0E530_9EURY|nr:MULTISPECIES: class I SAM-dependent methyltransferase [Halorubrum]ELZ42158.1 methyltransferase type 11 [Halorubrum californiense DSM 19288]TKX70906.1 class I SAM-dependent methyltransferase [Halorubrum sp. GN11GM_10-3_MGM]
MTDTDWDERFASGEYPPAPEPSPVLRAYEPSLPGGRALDIATGTGRNAVFLADRGHDVDALDASGEGLRIVRERAAERGLADRIETIQGDVSTYGFPTEAYDLVTMSYFHTVDRFADLVESLAPGGYLFVEGHLRSAEPSPSGPSDDRYRFAANELLRAGLGLSVRYYDETTAERPGDRRRAAARLLARKSSGGRQSYPERPDPPDRWSGDETESNRANDATTADRDA